MSNQQPQQNQQQQQRPNPFRSRFGNQQQAQPAGKQNPPQPQRGSLLNRMGPQRLSWEIVPVSDTLVRFDLTGLGDPFHRLLGHTLNVDYGDPQHVIRAMEQRVDGTEAMEVLLDDAWAGYKLEGAAMMFYWSNGLRQAIANRPAADIPQQQQQNNDEDDSEDEQAQEPPKGKPVALYRAVDMLLVLNVLARARSQLLIAQAPLALESRYLNRSLVSDDPRLVALALATGCIEEHL